MEGAETWLWLSIKITRTIGIYRQSLALYEFLLHSWSCLTILRKEGVKTLKTIMRFSHVCLRRSVSQDHGDFLHLSFSSFSLTFPWFDNDHLILRPVKSDLELQKIPNDCFKWAFSRFDSLRVKWALSCRYVLRYRYLVFVQFWLLSRPAQLHTSL